MPSPLSSPDTLPRAVLEKAPPAAAVLTPEQQAAKSIREKAAESSPRNVLESLRERKTPIDQGKIDRVNVGNIGVERNTDGSKKLDAAEQARLRDAKTYETSAKNFLEKGYGGLSGTEQREIRTRVEQTIRAWPEADALLSSKTPAEQRALIEELIKDPKFAAKVRGVFDASLEVDVPEISAELKTEFEKMQVQEANKNAEKTRNASEKTTVDAGLEQFADRSGTGGAKGAKFAEIERITRELPTLTADLETKQDQLADTSDRIRDLERTRTIALQRDVDTATIDDELTTKRGEARTLQREISRINETINKKTALEQEKAGLETRRQQLETERVRFQVELDEIVRQRIAAQTDFASAKMTREGQEQGFVDGLRTVFSESAYQYLEEKITAAEAAQRTLIEEEKARTVDPAEKAILDGLLTRWEKPKTVGMLGKRTTSVIDGEKTREDWGKCMTDMAEGPKTIMKEMLTKGGMSAVDADAKLADSAFVEKMQPKVIERLTTRRIQTGKLTMDDARRIIENPTWGKAIIDAAITNRQDIRNALVELEGKGILRGGIAEYLRNKSSGSKLKFLLILLGIAALGVGPAAMGLKNVLSEK